MPLSVSTQTIDRVRLLVTEGRMSRAGLAAGSPSFPAELIGLRDQPMR
jgi:hypothetical protein